MMLMFRIYKAVGLSLSVYFSIVNPCWSTGFFFGVMLLVVVDDVVDLYVWWYIKRHRMENNE